MDVFPLLTSCFDRVSEHSLAFQEEKLLLQALFDNGFPDLVHAMTRLNSRLEDHYGSC